MRWVLSLVLALAAGIGALYWQTDGFTVLTAEGARRNEVAQHPRAIPDIQVMAEWGSKESLLQNLHSDGRVAIVYFFYSRCMSLCLAQGSQAERLQRAIDERGLDGRVRLLGISFDPRDGATELTHYARRMGAEDSVWQFVSIHDAAQRERLLSLFGIIVVPAPLGQFEHNAAFHIVTADGRLARIFDLDEPGLALEAAEAMSAG
ncbi:MAG: SCO family protein [Alcaligenaceae bacterium]|nr:SCO family protein [Alcaligenaceae bacterium]